MRNIKWTPLFFKYKTETHFEYTTLANAWRGDLKVILDGTKIIYLPTNVWNPAWSRTFIYQVIDLSVD